MFDKYTQTNIQCSKLHATDVWAYCWCIVAGTMWRSICRPVDHHNKRATLMRDCTVNWDNEIVGLGCWMPRVECVTIAAAAKPQPQRSSLFDFVIVSVVVVFIKVQLATL